MVRHAVTRVRNVGAEEVGAYAIQSRAGMFVDRGDYTRTWSVLSLALAVRMLGHFGVYWY